MRFILPLLCAASFACTTEALQVIDGIPIGGGHGAAGCLEWVIAHYSDDKNAEVFATAKGKQLEYLVNLCGRGRHITYVHRARALMPGRVPAEILIIGDGDETRRSATVEAWYHHDKQAIGFVSFSLGVRGADGSWEQRARRDSEPQRIKELGTVDSFRSNLTTAAIVDGSGNMIHDFFRTGIHTQEKVATLTAGDVKALRLLEKIVTMMNAVEGDAKSILSGFPVDSEVATIGLVAIRWQQEGSQRLFLKQGYTGGSTGIDELHLTLLGTTEDEQQVQLHNLRWNGADWQTSLVEDRAATTVDIEIRR